jgi:hypothetical protein
MVKPFLLYDFAPDFFQISKYLIFEENLTNLS